MKISYKKNEQFLIPDNVLFKAWWLNMGLTNTYDRNYHIINITQDLRFCQSFELYKKYKEVMNFEPEQSCP
jgi:hypothetical protein